MIVRNLEEHPELAVAGRRVRHHVGRLDVEALCATFADEVDLPARL